MNKLTFFGYRLFIKATLLCAAAILFSSVCAHANRRDSFRTALIAYKAEDTLKVLMYADVASQYIDYNFDSAIKFAQDGLALGISLNYLRGKGNCLRMMGFVYEHKNKYLKAQEVYREALALYRQIGDKTLESKALRSIAVTYYRLTNYSAAIDYNNQSITVATKIKDFDMVGMALIDIGGIYTEQTKYTEALNYYLKGLQAFEKIKDNKGTSMALINIATVYSATGNYKMSSLYLNKAIPINDGLSEKEVVFANTVNIGVVYGDMKDYHTALKLFDKAAILADSIGDHAWQNMVQGNIADAYLRLGYYDSAYKKFIVVCETARELNDTFMLIMAQSSIGQILVKKGKPSEALKELLPAYNMAWDKQMKQSIFDLSHDISEAYEQLHDYAHALTYQKIYFAYHDTLNNEKNGKQIQQLQFDYELEKKENQIEVLNNHKILAQSKSEKQKVVQSSLLAGLLLLVIISILLYRNIVMVKRTHRKIVRQKEHIQLQATKLEDLVRFKDKTFSVLSHDLRGPMGTLTTAMMMMDEYILSPEDFARIKPEINRQINSLNGLLDNLLNWAKSSIQGEVHARPEVVNLRTLTDQNASLLKEAADRKEIKFKLEMPAEAPAYCDPGQADIVLRNLISNAIKFTHQKGEVVISYTTENGKACFSILDSGVGMSRDQMNKLFLAAPGNNTYGTDGEKGTGLGLLLCHEFVKGNNGTIHVDSEINKGSKFIVYLPLKTPVEKELI